MKLKKRPMTVKIEELLTLQSKSFGSKLVQTVDARNVWKWLEVSSRFADWIKRRIEDGQFDENIDYVRVLKKMNRGENNKLCNVLTEYYVSLDMAKHLCMLERNAKGKEARNYFVKVEAELLERLNASRQKAFEKCDATMILRNQSYGYQRENSNIINSVNALSEKIDFEKRLKAQNYNFRNCLSITERTPRDWRDEGNMLGLPRWVCRSAKEVARRTQPEMAASRSIADELVAEGINESVAFEIGRALIMPCKMLIDSGYTGERNRLRREVRH